MACAVGAVLFAHALAPSGARAIFKTGWPALIVLTVGAVVAFQFALYLLDLYNLRVAGEDRTRGQRMMKAAGAAAIILGAANGLARLQLPPGAAMGAAMGAVFGVLLVRAAMNRLVGQAAKVLIVGDGAKARALSQVLMD